MLNKLLLMAYLLVNASNTAASFGEKLQTRSVDMLRRVARNLQLERGAVLEAGNNIKRSYPDFG